jgi:hypothetical protein
MFGCMARLGCLGVLLVGGAAAYLTRDRWMPRITGERPAVVATWQPVSDSAATRAERSLESLGSRRGPVFVNLTPGELASLLLARANDRVPASAIRDAEAAVEGETVRVRATLALDELRGVDGLGPLATLLQGNAPVELAGSLDMLRPGLGQFRVETLKIQELALPPQAIPKVIARLHRGARPDSVAANAIPFAVPSYIGDIRVSRGRITLYKNVQ